ncbi:hypothetical protein N7495_003856 [Penicillium taxi]|uniref:uncharacterized protein n=1 Tax=Penicillium taxi TaxID=168475 RepID=UPI0025453645|nr:uncharacterized protein N7495_003856 [Penicillium taxi]KAJ5899112.1 hypothetical protein N7495_003856 [Penicillium taxi]
MVSDWLYREGKERNKPAQVSTGAQPWKCSSSDATRPKRIHCDLGTNYTGHQVTFASIFKFEFRACHHPTFVHSAPWGLDFISATNHGP